MFDQLHFDRSNVATASSNPIHAALVAAVVLLVLAVQWTAFVNHDVAFLTWTADQVLGPATFGRDIYEPNPPLAFLIYSPAAILAPFLGFDLSIKLWIAALASLSLIVLLQTAPKPLRLPVATALGLFFALAYPREFGQREQIALLLCAPYVAGSASSRGWAITSGVMAGIGFAIKPHFLIALVLVFLSRRRVRTEEWSIVFAGACYATIILLFFRPYLFEMLPKTTATYWGISPNERGVNRLITLAVFLLPCLSLWGIARDRSTIGYLMASFGFGVSAVVQNKLFPYHFLPAWGFLLVFLVSTIVLERRYIRSAAVGLMSAALVLLCQGTLSWIYDSERRSETIPDLVREIDKANSFTVFSVHPYPAFPTAIYTSTPYVGLSSSHWFLPSVGKFETGEAEGSLQVVSDLALNQAVEELQRRPELVIVDTDWRRHTGLKGSFDGLAWLARNASFRSLWIDYVPHAKIGDFQLFKRHSMSPEVPDRNR